MRRNQLRPTGMLCSIAAFTMMIAGCPLPEPAQNDLKFALTPGTYYVEQHDSKVFYYQLAQTRGETGAWVELPSIGDWFVGAGFYVLDDESNWAVDQETAGLTLDEFIQLHDPAPTP